MNRDERTTLRTQPRPSVDAVTTTAQELSAPAPAEVLTPGPVLPPEPPEGWVVGSTDTPVFWATVAAMHLSDDHSLIAPETLRGQ